ncbi:MAG: hypothetical protein IPO09_19025 [Anaeromyxobacter sp.]|nr:hypothetical protein [Anaeromyxobacter sp.]MBL0276009.1 hypothetical protein [Anaeromyxobacter sp.]
MEPAAPVAVAPTPADQPNSPAPPPVVELRRGGPSMGDFADLERATREEAGKLATRLDRIERERTAPPPAPAASPAAASSPAAPGSPWRVVGLALVVLLVILAAVAHRRRQVAG